MCVYVLRVGLNGLWSKASRIKRPQTCLFELVILQ